MQAMVGQEAPFDHGREQMKVLAGLEVTAKSVERTAEAIGADIAQREQAEIQQSRAVGSARRGRRADSHPVRANGWDRRAGGEERDGGPARQDRRANRPIRAKSSWGASSPRPPGMRRATPSAIRIPPPIPAPSKPPRSSASASIVEAWKRGWSRAQKKVGHGRWGRMDLESGRPSTFPAPCRLSISTTLASICGTWRASCTPTTKESRKPG